MVKNKGGNKAKKQGRKFVSQPQISNFTRMVKEEDETYAIVQKCYGHGMVDVLCIDNIVRLCIIRNKFKGRGKQDNLVKVGSWLLVGLRSWEIVRDKKPKCDLLEVYNDIDINKIKNSPINKEYNFAIFNIEETNKQSIENETIEFIESFDNELQTNNEEENCHEEQTIDIENELNIDGISFDDI
jgi:initiation factor 1A